MHRHLAATLGALVLVLSTAGAVSADTAGPSGANLELSWTACHGTVCTDASLYVDVLKKGGSQACVYLINLDASGQACTTDVGTIIYSGKFIVGIGDTTIAVPNFGSITVSASTSLVGSSFPWTGCASGDSWKGEAYLVSGTLTVSGDTEAAEGRTNVHTTHSAKKC
jgi:hypothetical protein